MRIGVNLPNYGPLGTRDAVTVIAERAEAHGYRSLWTSDHILLPTSEPEPFGHLLESLTTLTWVAAHTRTIGSRPDPRPAPTGPAPGGEAGRHLAAPLRGTAPARRRGRWIEREYEFLRADFGDRGAIETEYIGALRALFEQDRPEFHGDHVEFADVLFSPRPATPLPIVVGASAGGPAPRRRPRRRLARALADARRGAGRPHGAEHGRA